MQTNASDIRKKLIEVFENSIPGFDPTLSLNRQINSLQIYALLPVLEKEFGVAIHSMEVTGQFFGSVNSIVDLLSVKLNR
jgi:acyl carrier protein